MHGSGVIGTWRAGFALGVVVVGAVAGLLLTIIVTARDILATAERALALANAIVDQTRPIWELDQVNTVAGQIQAGAESIASHAEAVADALDASRPA